MSSDDNSGRDTLIAMQQMKLQSGKAEAVPFRKLLSLDAPRARYTGFEPGTVILKKGTVRRRGALPLPCDILFERDVPVRMRDGVIMYTDVYRLVDGTPGPALVGWGPYGKQFGGLWWDDLPGRGGVALDKTSQLEKFEGPDPAYWVQHGYVVLSPDPRGCYASEGDIHFVGQQTAEDGYDFIEWAAEQAWSNGKVGMCGNSWLAAAQWYIAAEKPPHLAAIAPWEGWSDSYRDILCRGGMPSSAFFEAILQTFCGKNGAEDVARMTDAPQPITPYWQDKAARLDAIETPAYVVASFTSRLHTRGTFTGYRGIASEQKWLRVHNTHEWPDFYEYADDLRRFFDHYLRGMDNGWENTPKVRLSVLDPGGKDVVNRPEREFPLARTRFRKLYLHEQSKLDWEAAPSPVRLSYDVAADGAAQFSITFDRDIELTGYMNLCVWMEADGADDLDLIASVEKLDKSGEVAQVAPDWYQGGEKRVGERVVNVVPMVTKATGRLRASHRELDAARSTASEPYLTHANEQRLKAGEIVLLQIGIWPMGMIYHAGETLRLAITAATVEDRAPLFGVAKVPVPVGPFTFSPEDDVQLTEIGGSAVPTDYQLAVAVPPLLARNKGRHVIHFGGKYESFLLIPEIPASA